jgi:TM2 domain-containing membrane protein YozV
MNCYQHPSLPAAAFCRTCGRGLCTECQRSADGTVFCQEHLPADFAYAAPPFTPPPDPTSNPYFQAPPPGAGVQTSPGLAFILGLIPGVGAIYNGQYFKGFIHVAILGLLISVASSAHMSGAMEPFVALLIGVWAIYMPFEAYHTARKRQMGICIDEWSSLLPRGSAGGRGANLPVGPVMLIVIGVLFLLDNLGLLPLADVLRYWPLLLIGLGVYLLYARMSGPLPAAPPSGSFPPPPPPSGDAMGVPYER